MLIHNQSIYPDAHPLAIREGKRSTLRRQTIASKIIAYMLNPQSCMLITNQTVYPDAHLLAISEGKGSTLC